MDRDSESMGKNERNGRPRENRKPIIKKVEREDVDIRNPRCENRPTEANADSGRRTGSGRQQNPGSGQQETRCFCVSLGTSTTAETRGYARLLLLPSGSHNAYPTLPHAVRPTLMTAPMRTQRVLSPASAQRPSVQTAMQS